MTAKPAAGILDTAHALYATPLRAFIGFTETTTAKFPVAQHANVTGLPDVPGIPIKGFAGKACGPLPTIINDDATYGPMRRFAWGSRAYEFPGLGYTAQPTGNIHTWAGVFRPRYDALASKLENACHSVLCCVGAGQTAFGPSVLVGTNGSLAFTFWRMGLYQTGSTPGQAAVSSTLTLTNGHIYIYAIKRGTTATTFWLYDVTAATLLSGVGGTAGAGDATLLFESPAPSLASIVVNPFPHLLSNNGVNNQIPFLGDQFAAVLYDAGFDDTAFLNFRTDVYGGIRAVSNGVAAGTLGGGQVATHSDVDGCYATVTDPTAKDGAVATQWYGSLTQNFTRNASTLLTGKTSPDLTLTRAEFLALSPANRPLYVAPVQTDSGASPESVTGFCRSSAFGFPAVRLRDGSKRIGLLGDSHLAINDVARQIGNRYDAKNYESMVVNGAWSATSIYDPTAATSWQPSAVQASTFLYDRLVLMIQEYGLTEIWMMPGTNDAAIPNDVATFLTKLSIVTTALLLVSPLERIRMILSPPRNDNATYSATLQTYHDAILSLCNESTIVRGDTQTTYMLAASNRFRPDQVHFDLEGYAMMAQGAVDYSLPANYNHGRIGI